MKYIFENIARIGLRSLMIGVISFVIFVPIFCCLIIIPLSLANDTNFNPLYLAIPFGLFMLLFVGGGVLFLLLVITKRKQTLDALFTPLGLAGNTYNLFYRAYQGSWQGREVGVYFGRGPLMTMEISTSLQTRLGISGRYEDTRIFANIAGKTPLTLLDPELQGLFVFPHDEAWARRLLENREAKAILQRLVLRKGWFNRQQVILRPGWLSLMYSGTNQLLVFNFNISPQEAQGWLQDLLALAQLAESLPEPPQPVVETESERLVRSMRKNTRSISKIVIAVTVFLAVGLPVVIIGAGVLITLLILSLD